MEPHGGESRVPQKIAFPDGPWMCAVCKESKAKTEFYIASDDKKQDYRCKVCRRAERTARWRENRNGCRDRQQQAYIANPEARKETMRRSHLLRTFGLTIEQYDAMAEAQGHVCAICHEPETKLHPVSKEPIRLAVDHDHSCCPGVTSCGKCVRKLLCARCNQVVGHIEDAGLWDGLAQYLTQPLAI